MPDGERVYAVNLLSRAALNLTNTAYEVFQNWQAEGFPKMVDPESTNFANVLQQNLFVLSDDFNELAFVKSQTDRERFQSKQLGLVIAPTMGCNFSCHYCFEHKTDTFLENENQNRLVELVESQLADYDELSVQWFGGEPLRAMSEIESLSKSFLKLAAEQGKAYAATIITNGYAMSSDVSQTLANLGVRSVQVTLDGDRALHDRTRTEKSGQGSFDVILKNVRDTPSEIKVSVRVHLSPFNYKSVSELIETLGEEEMQPHIDNLYFAPLFNYKVGMESPAYETDGKRFASSEEFASMQIEILRKAQSYGFKTKDFLDVSYGICTAVRSNTLVVDTSGNLMKCYKDVGVSSEAIGNLLTGPQPSPNESKWLDIDLPRDEECRECKFMPVCLGGCTKQWHEGADKAVICTPLKYNFEDRIKLYFSE